MSGRALAITGADPGAAESLGAIGFAAWQASAFGRDDAGRADRDRLREAFRSFFRDAGPIVLVARLGGDPVGWGAREHADNLISDLWVAPSARGRGVGAALLGALEAAIASQRFDCAELETCAGNSGAVRFYERHGYRPIWRAMKHSAGLTAHSTRSASASRWKRADIGLGSPAT